MWTVVEKKDQPKYTAIGFNDWFKYVEVNKGTLFGEAILKYNETVIDLYNSKSIYIGSMMEKDYVIIVKPTNVNDIIIVFSGEFSYKNIIEGRISTDLYSAVCFNELFRVSPVVK